MHEIDRRIIKTLNTLLVDDNKANSEITKAESCAFFFRKLHENSRERHTFIKECIQPKIDFVQKMETQVENNKTDVAAINLLNISNKKV